MLTYLLLRCLVINIQYMGTNLVTLGFRCDPALKSSLFELANRESITLSQYVNELVVSGEGKYRKLSDSLNNYIEKCKTLESRLAQYESQTLKNLFEKCKGLEVTLVDVSGTNKLIEVKSLIDLHEIITKSFKI